MTDSNRRWIYARKPEGALGVEHLRPAPASSDRTRRTRPRAGAGNVAPFWSDAGVKTRRV